MCALTPKVSKNMKKHLRFRLKKWENDSKNWRNKPECQKLGQILHSEYPSLYERQAKYEKSVSNATPVLKGSASEYTAFGI